MYWNITWFSPRLTFPRSSWNNPWTQQHQKPGSPSSAKRYIKYVAALWEIILYLTIGKRCGRRRRSISIKRYASLATMPWSLSMLSFHFFQPSNCTLCSKWWWFFFSTLALLCICTYSYIKVVLGWKKLQQGCAERWLSHGLPFPPPSFLASFASAVMQYMPPALPFQKYLHNIYKIFTKYYNCSNAIHATSSAISKYFHVILKKVQSQGQSTNCLFNFIKEHKTTESYLPEDDQNYGNQKFLE